MPTERYTHTPAGMEPHPLGECVLTVDHIAAIAAKDTELADLRDCLDRANKLVETTTSSAAAEHAQLEKSQADLHAAELRLKGVQEVNHACAEEVRELRGKLDNVSRPSITRRLGRADCMDCVQINGITYCDMNCGPAVNPKP